MSSVTVGGCQLSFGGCQQLIVGRRLSLTFSIVGAQLWHIVFISRCCKEYHCCQMTEISAKKLKRGRRKKMKWQEKSVAEVWQNLPRSASATLGR
jgi:hypothetical protein